MVIAFRGFQDREYFVSRGVFLEAGFEVAAASSRKGTALGSAGGEERVGLALGELAPADFDAVVFIGGPGAAKFIGDAEAGRIAKEAVRAGKILGAICIAPAILAEAGVLKGKRAVVWSSELDKSAVKMLEAGGASPAAGHVAVDGKIVTANGPPAAEEFAAEIVRLLTEKR